MNQTGDPLHERLTLLLQLEKRARQALPRELPFVVVNETAQLIPYDQAALQRVGPDGRAKLAAVSGAAVPDPNAPYPMWLSRVLAHCRKQDWAGTMRPVSAQDFPQDLAKDWAEWLPSHGLWIPLAGPGNKGLGGLALFRDSEWQEAELHVLSYLAGAYGHALALADTQAKGPGVLKRLGKRRALVATLLILLVLSFVPIRESVLAPAEVTARNPVFIRAPLAGVVDEFHVSPNEEVAEGQLLLSLDGAELSARLDVARKAYEIAGEEYLQASRQAISDPLAKARVAILESRMEQEAAEVAYVEDLLQRLQVTAPIAGVAVFDDPDDWVGRPVVIGQKILEVAAPGDLNLTILLPAQESINLDSDADLNFFLNVSPERPVAATLSFAGYHAEDTPEAGMAFRLKAEFGEEDPRLRIGLRGTAKIYGERKPLIAIALRKPLTLIRQWLAW